MKRSLLLCLLSLSGSVFAQNTSQLTLVPEEGFNEFRIEVSNALFGSGVDMSMVSGTIDAVFNIDPETGQTNEFTITEGTLAASDVNYSIGSPLLSVTAEGRNLRGTVMTINPPGVVDPITGEFDTSQHEVIINEGSFSGVTSGLTSGMAFENDLSETPAGGPGNGVGSVILTEASVTATRKNYDVEVTMPVDLTETLEVQGLIADVNITGMLKATGSTFVYRSPYLQWTEENGVPGAAFEGASLSTVKNGILYALGFEGENIPDEVISVDGKDVTIQVAAEGTRQVVMVETSADLERWSAQQIEAGRATSVVIPGSTEIQFVRLIVEAE